MDNANDMLRKKKTTDISNQFVSDKMQEEDFINLSKSVNEKAMLEGHKEGLFDSGDIGEKTEKILAEEAKLREEIENQDEFRNIKDAARKEAVSALYQNTTLKARNAFDMTGGAGYKAAEELIRNEKKQIEGQYNQIKKAIEEFSSGRGGNEFKAVKRALNNLAAAEKEAKKRGSQDVDMSYYDAVRMAAQSYMDTHQEHKKLKESRRFMLAQALIDDIANKDYLEERNKELEKELKFAKEDSKTEQLEQQGKLEKAVKSGKSGYREGTKGIKKVTSTLTWAARKVKKAFTEYTRESTVITLNPGEKLGYMKHNPKFKLTDKANSVTTYQLMNGIKRGLFTRNDIQDFFEKAEKNIHIEDKEKVKNTLESMEIMDAEYEQSSGLKDTAHLYRGFGIWQVSSFLGLSIDALKDLHIDANKLKGTTKEEADKKIVEAETKKEERIQEVQKKLDDLVGKVYVDKGFTSTSMKKEVADGFLTMGEQENSPIYLMMDIVARKGTKAYDVDSISAIGTEAEVLLKPGSRFFIRSYSIGQKLANENDPLSVRPLVTLHVEVR